jgi:putative ABC transport system permease protein
MLLAMGSANLRVLDSLKEADGSSKRSLWNSPTSQSGETGGTRRIWRARRGQLTTAAFDHCLTFMPSGVRCLGLTVRQTRDVWREDAKKRNDLPTVTLVAVAGSPFEVISPMISPALVPFKSYFRHAPVATFNDPDLTGGRSQDHHVLIDHDSSSFGGHDSIEASVDREISFDAAEKILDQIEDGFGDEALRVDPDAEFEARKNLTASYRLNLSILGLMSVLVSGLLLRNTAALQMMLRRPVVAVLRQTGASRRTIMGLVLSEQILIAVAGCAAGIVGGLLLEQAISHQVMKTVRVLYTPDAGNGQRSLLIPIVGATGAGLVVYLASSFAMLRSLVAVQPRDLAAREFEGRERQADAGRVAKGWRMRLAGIALSVAILLIAPTVPPVTSQGNLQVPLFGYFAAMAIVILAFSAASGASYITTRLLRIFVPEARAHRFPALAISTRRNLHARRRPEAAVATLATGLALVTGISLMVAGFRNSFTAWLAQSFTAEVVALPLITQDGEFRPRLDGDSHNLLRKTMQVDTDCVLLDEGTVRAPGNQSSLKGVPVRVAAIDDALPPDYPTPLETIPWPGTRTSVPNNEILREFMNSEDLFLASEALARKLKLKTGDQVQLGGIKSAGTHNFTGRIAGVVRDYSSELGYLFLSKKSYETRTGLNGCHSLRVYTAGVNAPAFASAVSNRLPEIASRLNIQSSDDLKKMATGTFEQTFKVTGLLTILAAILGGVALIVQIAQSSAGRRLEWLALRRLGSSWTRLTQLLAADVLISVLAGLALGLVCGGIMAWLLVVVINRQAFGWSIAMPGISDLATAVLFAVAYAAALWLAGVIMSWWTMRPGKAWEVLRE